MSKILLCLTPEHSDINTSLLLILLFLKAWCCSIRVLAPSHAARTNQRNKRRCSNGPAMVSKPVIIIWLQWFVGGNWAMKSCIQSAWLVFWPGKIINPTCSWTELSGSVYFFSLKKHIRYTYSFDTWDLVSGNKAEVWRGFRFTNSRRLEDFWIWKWKMTTGAQNVPLVLTLVLMQWDNCTRCVMR